MENTTIKEMNKFLKGIHMGQTTFRDYLEKAQDNELKGELVHVLESFKKHEEFIIKDIENLGGIPSGDIGVIGVMAEFFEKIKLVKVDSDLEVCKHSINAMEMGIKQGKMFIEEHENLDENLKMDVEGVVKDYDNHLRHIEELMKKYN